MLEAVTHFCSGENAYPMEFCDEANAVSQEFTPTYTELSKVSFLMWKDDVTVEDGSVTVSISDEQGNMLYVSEVGIDEVEDGSFTDFEFSLNLAKKKKYYLTIVVAPSSEGEYPAIGLCDRTYKMPENKRLLASEEIKEAQLVSRYVYTNVLLGSKIRNVLIICLITAVGIMVGVPDNKYVRIALGVGILLICPYILGRRLEMLVFRPWSYRPFAMKWNIGVMYGLELIVLVATQSFSVSIVLTNLALTVLYTANYFVATYRGGFLRVNDFSAAGTAMRMLNSYNFMPNDHLALVWSIMFLIAVYGVQTRLIRRRSDQDKERDAKYLRMRIVSYAVSISAAAGLALYGKYLLFDTDMLSNAGITDEGLLGMSYDELYYANGYLIGSCVEIKNSKIKEPEGYSVEAVEEILKSMYEESDGTELSEEQRKDLPHVILIMDESFTDLRILGDLELNTNNLVFFDSLKENTVRGYVNASMIGGGTANSEFEVFTGCSMAFLPNNYYPYQQGVKRPLNSLVSRMEKYGYTTWSMHPQKAVNYRRHMVYSYFGFDEKLWIDDFEGAEVIHNGVSDQETFNKVIDIYEHREEGEKLFIFDLTMQNHGEYPGKSAPYAVKSAKYENAMIDEFLSLMKITDDAFKDLVQYFEDQDEKVVICIYGDHQPWLSDLILDPEQLANNGDVNGFMKKYKTPFLIWANYDIEEAEGYDISMNYLGGLLEETAGIPLSPYFAYVRNMRDKYPVITANGYMDAAGTYHDWHEENDDFDGYRMLQYNYLYDDDTVEWGF